MSNGSAFHIEVVDLGGLSVSQKAAFAAAAARWSQVIVGDLPSVRINGQVIDDVRIQAQGIRIDGPLGVLGQAAPRHLRPRTFLPATGFMQFDTADLARMEEDGSLLSVILHEMGHVLGIGTIWRGFLSGSGTANPVFTAQNAMREFAQLIGEPNPIPVPVENRGGAGTREGHWRESVFGNELMTGFLSGSQQPLSRMTVAALQDLGYQVNFEAADPFALPSALQLALMGIGADEHYYRCLACEYSRRGEAPIILPEETLV